MNAAAGLRYDVILMDMQMPVMDGLAATAQIRAAEPSGQHVPIIAMTANAFKEDEVRCLAAGMDGYLTKPIKPQVLERTLRRYLATGAPADPPAVDTMKLDELRRQMSQERFSVLKRYYLESSARTAARIQKLLQVGDLGSAGRLSTNLVASSVRVGARSVEAGALAISRACEAGDAAEARRLVPALLDTLQAVSHQFGLEPV